MENKTPKISEVYFIDIKDKNLLERLGMLYDKLFSTLFKKDEIVAVKMHFGELGNTAYLKPKFVKVIIDRMKKLGIKPFLTDTNTLYKGHRGNSVDHLENANANGYSIEKIGVPVIIADGIFGNNFKEVEINKKFFKTVKIGADIANIDAMFVLSHFKGHLLTGFGGAIKNLGMGCASRAGKQQEHSAIKPSSDEKKCINCKKCGKYCPADAISYEKGHAFIDINKCIGCGECTIVCPTGALSIRWDSRAEEAQKKMAEYAFGAVKDKRVGFITFVMDISPDCDCFDKSEASIVSDIGILASNDPVALDQACFDLVNKALGIKGTRLKDINSKDKFKDVHGVDATVQLKHGEEIGLGTRKYKLMEF